MARVSVLLAAGKQAATSMAHLAKLDVSTVLDMVSREGHKGECYTHLDYNDTGTGDQVHEHVPWGQNQLNAVEGMSYIHGHEGLDVGGGVRMHENEELWHLVLVISCGCTENERQAICGWEEGDATCVFEFPATDPTLPGDDVRVFVYALDYSRRPHGNPKMGAPMGENAWCMRFTPYGTTHTATWAGIIRHVSERSPERAHAILNSLKENAGSHKLGCKGMSERMHAAKPRAGREAPTRVAELAKWNGRICVMHRVGSGEEVSRGLLLPRFTGHVATGVSIGNTDYVPGEHEVSVDEAAECEGRRGSGRGRKSK